MKRCRDGPARTVCTFLLLCLLKFGGITGVRWSLSHLHVLSIQYTTMAMAALRWYSFIKCVGSTFVLLRVRLNLTLLLMFDAVWVRNCACMRYFAIQTHYNGDDESALTGWMHAMGVVLARNEQHVRLYYCVAVRLNLTALLAYAVWGLSLTLMMCCPNIYTTITMTTTLCWSSFLVWMYGTGVNQGVRLYFCVRALSWIWSYYWCSMQYVRDCIVISPSCAIFSEYTTMAMIALHWSSFVRWMYDTGVVLTLNKQVVCTLLCGWIWFCY